MYKINGMIFRAPPCIFFGYVRWGLLQFKMLCFGELCAERNGVAIKYKAAGGTWLASQSGRRLSSWSSRQWHVMERKPLDRFRYNSTRRLAETIMILIQFI